MPSVVRLAPGAVASSPPETRRWGPLQRLTAKGGFPSGRNPAHVRGESGHFRSPPTSHPDVDYQFGLVERSLFLQRWDGGLPPRPPLASARERLMPEHRVYLMTFDSKIQNAIDLRCADDRQAIARVTSLPWRHRMELWQRARKVHVFPAPGPPPTG
jgi:hypothetical protein